MFGHFQKLLRRWQRLSQAHKLGLVFCFVALATIFTASAFGMLDVKDWFTLSVFGAAVLAISVVMLEEGNRRIRRLKSAMDRRLANARSRGVAKLHSEEIEHHKAASVASVMDAYLRNIGTDLHDGPAQTISFAVLKVDEVRKATSQANRKRALDHIEEALGEALIEIRAVATDMVLPDIAEMGVRQIIIQAINAHMRRTGLIIALDCEIDDVRIPVELGACVYRFTQEGLNNAFHHGVEDGHSVVGTLQGGVLHLAVHNRYVQGRLTRPIDHRGLGLYGLKARIESVGGKIAFTQIDSRTRLEMWLPLA